MDKEKLRHIVVNALRQTIAAHGPINPENIGSATKRIVGSVLRLHKQTSLSAGERNGQAKTKDIDARQQSE